MRRPRRVEPGALVEVGEAAAESGSAFDLGVGLVLIVMLGWLILPTVLGVACREALACPAVPGAFSSDCNLLAIIMPYWEANLQFLVFSASFLYLV